MMLFQKMCLTVERYIKLTAGRSICYSSLLHQCNLNENYELNISNSDQGITSPQNNYNALKQFNDSMIFYFSQ